jgi:hypothetical protein
LEVQHTPTAIGDGTMLDTFFARVRALFSFKTQDGDTAYELEAFSCSDLSVVYPAHYIDVPGLRIDSSEEMSEMDIRAIEYYNRPDVF